jgi:membrane dipeptidase
MRAPEIRDDVRAFHAAQIVIDLHVDSIIQQRLFRYDMRKRHRPLMRRQPFIWQADIPRMLEGGYTAAAMGIHYWPFEWKRGWRAVGKQLAYLERVVATDERVLLARTAADIERAHAEGKLALMAGLEGAHLLGGDLAHLDEAAARGALYLTVAHFSRNRACTPGMGRKSNQRDGLTDWGRELVARLEELALVVDVAHVNRPGVLDLCAVAKNPVFATHTCAVGLHENDRGLTDEGLAAVAETGGVIGIIFGPNFLRGTLNAPLDAVADHVAYVAEKVGGEHLALGTDFDGWLPAIPNDIRDCRDLPLLTQRLLDRGLSRETVAGMLGQNTLRVIRQVRGA